MVEYIKKYFPLLARHTPLSEELSTISTLHTFKTGDILLKEGAYVKLIPLVLSGLVKVYKEDDMGNEVLLYYIKSGESCVMSLNACFKNEKSSVKAIVEEEAEIILLPAQKGLDLAHKYPQWNEFTFGLFSSKYQELLHIVNILTFSNKETRLMEYLKKKKAYSKTAIMKVTHQEVANDLGSTREVISRLLKKLEHEGQVKLGQGVIEVL